MYKHRKQRGKLYIKKLKFKSKGIKKEKEPVNTTRKFGSQHFPQEYSLADFSFKSTQAFQLHVPKIYTLLRASDLQSLNWV